MAPRITRCQGFSASVIGPPNARKICHMTIRYKIAQDVYWRVPYAFVIKGKYSSIAVMSVPRASRNRPDTASRIVDAILAIQLTIPSKIQSKMGITSSVNWISAMTYLAIVVAALDQGLQVGDDEAKRIQNNPCHNDSLQPAGSLVNGSLIP